jgi:hypothetical protein
MQQLEKVRRVANNIEQTLELQADEVEAERTRRQQVTPSPPDNEHFLLFIVPIYMFTVHVAASRFFPRIFII